MPNSEGPDCWLVVTFPLSVWCSLSSVRCDITHSEAVPVLHYSALPPPYSPLSLSRHCTPVQPALQLLCSSIIVRVKTTPQSPLTCRSSTGVRPSGQDSPAQCLQTRCFQYCHNLSNINNIRSFPLSALRKIWIIRSTYIYIFLFYLVIHSVSMINIVQILNIDNIDWLNPPDPPRRITLEKYVEYPKLVCRGGWQSNQISARYLFFI